MRDFQMQLSHHAQLCDPAIHRMIEPVFIRQHCAAIRGRPRPPRVMNYEPVSVIADNRKGMATVTEASFPTRNHPIPAFVMRCLRESFLPSGVADSAGIED